MAAPRRKADANDTPTSKGSASKGSAGKGSAGKGSKGGASTSKGSKGGGRWSKGGSKGKSAGLRALDLAAHLEAPARGYLLLGEERFQAGIRRYLEAHQYANTETTDLWDAIEAAADEPVREMMDAWIFRPGHPVVTVS